MRSCSRQQHTPPEAEVTIPTARGLPCVLVRGSHWPRPPHRWVRVVPTLGRVAGGGRQAPARDSRPSSVCIAHAALRCLYCRAGAPGAQPEPTPARPAGIYNGRSDGPQSAHKQTDCDDSCRPTDRQSSAERPTERRRRVNSARRDDATFSDLMNVSQRANFRQIEAHI